MNLLSKPWIFGDPKQIKPGDICFARHKTNKISSLMAWFMNTEWSHSITVYDIGERDIHTIETSDFEMTCHLLSKYLEDPDTYTLEVWRIDGAQTPEHGLVAVNAMIGTIYGYLQLIPFALRCLIQKWTRFCIRKNCEFLIIPAPKNTWVRQGQVCTAGPYTYLKHSRTPGFIDVDPESLHTEDLYQEVITHPGRKLILSSRKV